MACRLDGTNPLSEPMLDYYLLDTKEEIQLNSNRNFYIFIQEN